MTKGSVIHFGSSLKFINAEWISACWMLSGPDSHQALIENVIFNENRSGRLLKSYLKKNIFKITHRDRLPKGLPISPSRHLNFLYQTQWAKRDPRTSVNQNPFATREPGQPSVRRRGMTTTSHTGPDASLSLLRRIGDTSITRVVKDL
ncbi:hypothetical protein LXL04_021577 [Taraxacum kok-saghyz]